MLQRGWTAETRICSESDGHFVERIQCPYHAWTYDLGTPAGGAAHAARGLRKTMAACDVWDGHISLSPWRNYCAKTDSVGVAEQLGERERFASWRMADLRRCRLTT